MDTYRWRAGVEATMSELDRPTGIKKLRVRGFGAVRFCAIIKAAELNLLRAARFRRAKAKALVARFFTGPSRFNNQKNNEASLSVNRKNPRTRGGSIISVPGYLSE
jgi:hypothetical protein